MTGAAVQKLLVVAVIVFMLSTVLSASAAETHLLKAKISDIEGRPMAGAKLFLYDTQNVRRPADFISALSDRAGLVQIVLPPAKYWVVARFKADGKYGPLMPGDKHSGEPLEVDVTGVAAEADFVVADIRELGQKKRATATDALRLKGRVLDSNGTAVAQAFVFANGSIEFNELPDFISAWTGMDGEYEIYIPPSGAYYIGASHRFPLTQKEVINKAILVETGKIDIAKDINFTVE